MKHRRTPPTPDALLLALAYELLDAHLDTIELRLSGGSELQWRAHLDYLRALRRKAEEIFVLVTIPGDPLAIQVSAAEDH